MADYNFKDETRTRTSDYPTLITEFEDQSEQRRNTTNKEIITIDIRTPPLTEEQANERYNFWKSKKGKLLPFTYNYRGVLYNVRFDSSIVEDYSGGLLRLRYSFRVINQVEEE